MASFSLSDLARRAGKRRDITLRPIVPTQAQATDLATIYAPAWRTWQESIDSIMAGYPPVPLPTHDALFLDTAAEIQSAIDAAASTFTTRLVTEITPSLRRWATRVESNHRSKWASSVNAGTAIDLSTLLTAQPVQETLDVFLVRNIALVRNVSEQAQGRIADAVFRGYQNRTPSRDVAKEIGASVGMGRDRARRIAADQNAKLSAALDMERQAEAGIEQYRWRHSGKAHPRAEHQARNGKLFKLGVPDGDTPGQAPFCGCRAQAYIPLMDELD